MALRANTGHSQSSKKGDFIPSTVSNSGEFKITTVDMHTAGGPVRIVTSGCPDIEGDTLLKKRKFFMAKLDHVRRILMCEPRGHFDMYGAVLVQPDLPDADMATLILNNNQEIVTMCGHAALAICRFAVDNGYVKPHEPETEVRIQYPCGIVRCRVEFKNGRSGSSTFQSVPAFVYATDVEVDVVGFGKFKVDICFGGSFYAILSADKAGIDLAQTPIKEVKNVGGAIAEAAQQQVKVEHPDSDDLATIAGVIFTDGRDQDQSSLQCCVVRGYVVDRAPCGSGTTARVALQHHRGHIKLNETKTYTSAVSGIPFTAKATSVTKCGKFEAVIVEVTGRSYYTGTSTFTVEEDDPLKHGFKVN